MQFKMFPDDLSEGEIGETNAAPRGQNQRCTIGTYYLVVHKKVDIFNLARFDQELDELSNDSPNTNKHPQGKPDPLPC